MRRTLLLFMVAFASQYVLLAQQPDYFSWDEVRTTPTFTRSFVSSVQEQPFQGPCLSYAFVAATEIMYNISFNKLSPNTLPLSVAYLDVKDFGATEISDYQQTLQNHGFKLPRRVFSFDENYRISSFLPSYVAYDVPEDDRGTYRGFVNTAKNRVDNEEHFRIENTETEPDEFWEIDNSYSGVSILSNDYLTVGNVHQFNPADVEAIKEQILTHGPLVIKVAGNIVPNFENYSGYSSSLNYHAYTIIGWEDQSSAVTKWKLMDPWPGDSKIFYSKSISNSSLMSWVNNNGIDLGYVDGIKLNGANSTASVFMVDRSLQGTLEVPVTLTLSSIDVDIDYAFIGGYLYHRFWVTSNVDVDSWVWGIDYPNGARKRSQMNGSMTSSVLLSPTTSGVVTVYVTATKDGVQTTKERIIFLSNGQGFGGIY